MVLGATSGPQVADYHVNQIADIVLSESGPAAIDALRNGSTGQELPRTFLAAVRVLAAGNMIAR